MKMNNEIRGWIRGGGLVLLLLMAISSQSFAGFLNTNGGCENGNYGYGPGSGFVRNESSVNLSVGCVVQYIFAGANDVADLPDSSTRGVTNDDILLATYAVGDDNVFTLVSGQAGLFYNNVSNAANNTNITTAHHKVYVRAWNNSVLANATYYGNSSVWDANYNDSFSPAPNDYCLATFSTNVSFIPLPDITSCSPVRYAGDTNVTMNVVGTNTHFTQGITTAQVSGTGVTVGTVEVTSATAAKVYITSISSSATAGGRDITLTTTTEVATGEGLFVISAPSFASVAPTSGYQGDTITGVAIVGTGTHFTGTPTVSFGSNITVSNVVVSNATHLTCDIAVQAGATAGARNVVVTTGSEIVTGTNVFTVNTPSFTSVTPTSGYQGDTITGVAIVGTGTHFTGSTTVSFGTNITVSSISVTNATHLTCTIAIAGSAATGARSVSVTTGGETVTGTNAFTVNAPSFTSVTPNSGAVGATLTGVAIVGTGTHFTGTPTVSFSGGNITVSNVVVSDATHLTCNVVIGASAAAGAKDVQVITGSETVTGTGVFTVTVAPVGSGGQLVYEKAGGIMMAYPNPFDPNDKANPLKMLFNTATGEAVDIYIFDTNARIIYQRRNADQLAADRTVTWDGETSYGEVVENGLYLIRVVKDGKLVAKGKILVIKK